MKCSNCLEEVLDEDYHLESPHKGGTVYDCSKKRILFYTTKDEYGFLSNFYRAKIITECPLNKVPREWMTSEHYYQAQKFTEFDTQEIVRAAISPKQAAFLGRTMKMTAPGWDIYRLHAMRVVLDLKFTQHKDLKVKLLATGNAELIEHTTNDNYWADGGDGSGKNMLGILLMELRQLLRD